MLTARSGLLSLVVVLAAAAPAPASARSCDVQRDSASFGVTYVTSLTVTKTTCARGKKVVRAFTTCRKAHGGLRGRCPRTASVLGYRCREDRSTIPTQFSSKVVCRTGHRRVVFTYSQNT